ncbi:MAG: hypothetical protein AB1746_02860 [Candidatus Zixiibacteriota bacterium]
MRNRMPAALFLASTLLGIICLQSCAGVYDPSDLGKSPVVIYRFDTYGSDILLVDHSTIEKWSPKIEPSSNDGIRLVQYTNPINLDRRQIILAFFDLGKSSGYLVCKFDGGITWARTDSKLDIRNIELSMVDTTTLLSWEVKGSELSASKVEIGYSGSVDTVCRWSLDDTGKPISIKAFDFYSLDNEQLTNNLHLGKRLDLSIWSSQQVAIPKIFIEYIDDIRLTIRAFSNLKNVMASEINSKCSDDVVLDGSKINENTLLEWSTQHLLDGKQVKVNLFAGHLNIQQFKDPATITERQVISTGGGNYEIGTIEVRPVLRK